MNEIEKGSGIYKLSKNEFYKLKDKAILVQNNNSPNRILTYHIIPGKERNSLLEYSLSLEVHSEPSYLVYKNVSEKKIEEITGIPFEDFEGVDPYD